MPFPEVTADMDVVRKILAQLKSYGLTDKEIAAATGQLDRNTIMRWRHGTMSTYPKNQDRLVLILDLVESIRSVVGPDCQKEYIQSFFSKKHRSLANSTLGQYLHQHGLSAREELILLAKNYATEKSDTKKASGSSAGGQYVLLHVRLDIEILSKYRLDKFEIAELINQEQRRIDELMSGTGKISHPTRHEAHQLRQAAATAVALHQHYHPSAIKGLMTGVGREYIRKWKNIVNNEESIIDIIGSQTEGDANSYDRAAFLLGNILARLTGKT